MQDKSPRDMRGTNPCTTKIPENIINFIDEHIRAFPLKETHYAGKIMKYLDARLDVKTMHEMFLRKYPNLNVKYDFYRKYFQENFGFSFGRPQIDVCGKCEELGAKIKSPHISESSKRAAQFELDIHKRRSRKFYNYLKQTEVECMNRNDIVGLAFDYMQNLPLPNIPVQETFYLRQLWVNCFCIYDIKSRRSTVYLYHEGEAKKGANEVCSFLCHYFDNYVSEEVSEVHLFSDGAPGQNKNNTIVRMCLAFTESGKFKKNHSQIS